MTLRKGPYLWVASTRRSKVVIVGADFMDTFQRASRVFWVNRSVTG